MNRRDKLDVMWATELAALEKATDRAEMVVAEVLRKAGEKYQQEKSEVDNPTHPALTCCRET